MIPSGFRALLEESEKIAQTEVMLERKVTDYSQIHHFSLNLKPFYQLWAIVFAFQEDRTTWEAGEVEDQDALRRKLLQTCQVLDKAGTASQPNLVIQAI